MTDVICSLEELVRVYGSAFMTLSNIYDATGMFLQKQ